LKIKVTYIISDINKAISFEWIAEMIDKNKITLSFILLNQGDSDLERFLISKGFLVKRISCKNKLDLPKAVCLTVLFLLKHKPKVVHTHLFNANLVGLFSAWICRIPTRIYTRHHSSYHHDYFPKAVKYDLMCNKMATRIIAITKIVSEILQKREHVPESKIKLIHHGFNLSDFKNVSEQEIEILKQKYTISGYGPVIGVISRYTEWKGIQFIIPAFKKLLLNYPQAKLVLANAQGDYKKEIHSLLQDIPKDNYVEIEFENNLFALYRLFDVFVHVPIDKYCEAFGQIYVEALASSVPSVFTLSGIANDFIVNDHNAVVVDYKNSSEIYYGLQKLLDDNIFAKKLAVNGSSEVERLFPVSAMVSELELLYLKSGHAKS
jgi:glycosyltransferase involved in cell wall biosynthesis